MAESEKHTESSSVHTLAVVSLIEKEADMKFPREDIEARGHLAIDSAWAPKKAELLVMISLSFISLMVALDATILVCVLPEIASDLNGTSAEAFWAGTSYLLTSAVFQPIIASISSLVGRQQMLIVSLAFFTIGTIFCSCAHDFAVMLTGRSIQGIGGGGIITLSQVIFCDIVPLRQRPKYFSMILGAWAIGTIIGPLIGGALVENTSWRWCFHINYPFCGIGFIVAILFVRLNAVTKLTVMEKVKRFDWIGAFIFIGSSTSFLIGISWGGVQHPWTSAATLAPIIVGVAGILVFFGWQLYKKENTLLPMSIFYCWSAIAAFYGAFVNGLILFVYLYYYPFYQMSVHGRSAIGAGVQLLPSVCLTLPASIVVSVITSRLGRFRWAIWGGWAILTLACGLTILFDLDTNVAAHAGIVATWGIGTGMILTGINIGIQAISKVEDCAMAASMYGFFRSLGMPIGVTIAGTAFQNAMSSELITYGLPTTIAHDSEQYVAVLATMVDSPRKTAILESYMSGFNAVFIMATAIAGSALVVSFAIRKFSMDKILLARFVAE